MHIAQMIDSLNWGGAQKLLVTFSQIARERGIEVTIICLRHDDGSPIPKEIVRNGASLVTYPSKRLLDPVRIWHLVDLMRRGRFDVVQTHLLYANVLGAVAGRLANVPVIPTFHAAGYDVRQEGWLKREIEAWAVRYGSKRIVAVGYTVAQMHQPHVGNRQINVIPNCVPSGPVIGPALRTELRTQMVGDAARTVLVSVGRLSPQKGYPDLLAGFAMAHRAHPETALAIIGGGALRDELTAQIKSLGLEEHAFLLGAREDVPQLLASADMYVSASHWEGLPLTILEAMQAYLPIVATAVGDTPSVVCDAGLLIPPHDPDAFAAALIGLLDDPARMSALAAAGHAIATRQYNAEVWFDQLIDLYKAASRTGRDHGGLR